MAAATIKAKSLIKSAAVSPVLDQTDWHALEPPAVSLLLNVDPSAGLTASQVSERQLQYGRNALQWIQSRPASRVLIDQFASIVIALLAIAAVISWATGDDAEAIAILIVLVLNAGVGFATEWQAGRALDALRRQSRTLTRVRRDGFESTVDAEELVPGDIVRSPESSAWAKRSLRLFTRALSSILNPVILPISLATPTFLLAFPQRRSCGLWKRYNRRAKSSPLPAMESMMHPH